MDSTRSNALGGTWLDPMAAGGVRVVRAKCMVGNGLIGVVPRQAVSALRLAGLAVL